MEETVRLSRAGWREEETDRLWREIRDAAGQGLPLRGVFEKLGSELGRKPNSVRNYYYMRLRARAPEELRRAAPFSTFSEEEVRELIKAVLLARGGGESVRSCVTRLAQGDKTRMLRYQNKYRSVLKKRPDFVRGIMTELRLSGETCPDPYARRPPLRQPPEVARLLENLDSLLLRAQSRDESMLCDKLRAQLDIALIRLEDTEKAAKDMLMTCKEFAALTPREQQARLPAFGSALRSAISALENAVAACG